MFSFRQKILIAYTLVFLSFISLMYPFTQRTVRGLVQKAMEDRASDLINRIQHSPSDEALIASIKEQKAIVFFRVSVINDKRQILYDSHTKRLLGPRFSQEHVVSHPEVMQAIREGAGYYEGWSEILGQEFAYFAKTFNFHGKTYVLRTAFPLEYIEHLSKNFEIGFLGSGIFILLLFSFMSWFTINYLTRPINQIIEAIKPYKEGKTDIIPKIELKNQRRTDEFSQLADTLNSLSKKIQNQIDTLTQERNEKEAVLESLTEGVIAVDRSNKIIFANNSVYNLLRKKPKDIVDKDISSIDQEKCTQMLELCQREGKPITDTLELKRHEEKIFLDLVAAPKKDKKGAILVLQDKTGHYKIIEMRKDFIANASHELRTPITTILGFAETLHDNPDLPEDTLSTITDKIVKNCHRMNNLIQDLLTLTDIEHIPQSRLIESDIFDLVQNSSERVKAIHEKANIKIIKTKDQDYYNLVDPNLMELALSNLIENAAKYSQGPAEITITLDCQDHWMTIAVKDKGIGIPKKEYDNIFLRFFRVDKSRSKKIGGTGLGLSIVQTIVAKHFGKIEVESEVGKGSTFTIYLPLKN